MQFKVFFMVILGAFHQDSSRDVIDITDELAIWLMVASTASDGSHRLRISMELQLAGQQGSTEYNFWMTNSRTTREFEGEDWRKKRSWLHNLERDTLGLGSYNGI